MPLHISNDLIDELNMSGKIVSYLPNAFLDITSFIGNLSIKLVLDFKEA
ncbi:hypothetical protein [Winogradskyella sediminis]|uniref:Uncharacterized protein n=1 Tax=Winogradskyella sediminis TaxID=1382466 RepID=A0A1H1LTT7_9FLAO|nr:hypothetical protein [Winogradskyella sediminis]SDR77913.1 hypothetical protein SAMN04489797_0096 [Winogradskyella sediminis]